MRSWWSPLVSGIDCRFLDFLDWEGVASMMTVGWIKLEFHGSESGFRNTP